MDAPEKSKQSESGLTRISTAFERALSRRTAALMPYYTLGYPDTESSLEIVEVIAPYCDLLELGIPFSDPIADGPTIQRSTQTALDNGLTSADCLNIVRELRARGLKIPILLMGYYNPILAYGEERFIVDALDAGVDGFIIPDLPLEESGELEFLTERAGLALIYFIAPTSNEERIHRTIARARGFIYLVSITGVTGARQELPHSLSEFVTGIKSRTELPLAVGFGISTPEQAKHTGAVADGVIVGSAVINAVDNAENKPAAAALFVRKLQDALAK